MVKCFGLPVKEYIIMENTIEKLDWYTIFFIFSAIILPVLMLMTVFHPINSVALILGCTNNS